MEKYSKWRDPATGIQPFLTPQPPRSGASLSGLPSRAGVYGAWLLRAPLIVVRMLLLLVVGIVWMAADATDALPSHHRGVRRVRATLRRWRYFVLGRTALFLCGFYRIDYENAPARRGAHQLHAHADVALPGDVLVSNYQSYFDVLLLATYDAPIFTTISETGRVTPISVWQALLAPLCSPGADGAPVAMTLREASLYAQHTATTPAPLCIFPEGTPSNGRAVLRFTPVFDRLDVAHLGHRVHVTSLRYRWRHACPAYTEGSRAAHVCRMLGQVYQTVQVRRFSSREVRITAKPAVGPAASGAVAMDGGAAKLPGDSAVDTQIAAFLCMPWRLKRVNFGVPEKRAFLAYVEEQQRGEPAAGRAKRL
ncbi:hypothetical protein CXG81DRAFT_15171 [Caulochytrium protostelioides]|uniref:Phospholipid/glycerol acyltransferase domain-containing protein n=1 Tax=Caulochytrium protostelioides TaxID=1555241 RepID=A0A4P9WZU1_9FUNG|nr:hypothetical protein CAUPRSCDRAFT_5590 [Caulochytrium protostelioides]RKO98991.1 hypothetical protein CXG81DRAFT_15171 [Caulochytrium protostelioides]|eukprot:RKO98991.1 hypothetical protein CXG81DRAFT_15171 [Caulochytrium protostelioides]